MSDLKNLIETYSKEARIAREHDKVYKDECVYTYDTSETSPNGLYVCLKTFLAISQNILPIHFVKTQSHLYLRIKTFRKKIQQPATAAGVADEGLSDEPEKKKPTKLGIGVDGGFDLNEKQFYFEHVYYLFVYPEEKELELTNVNLSNLTHDYLTENVRRSIESIIKAESVTYKEELAAQAASWDGEIRIKSKHSTNLLQLPNKIEISPNPESWKCERCDIRKNLWLNLTDGKILCGRKQLDGSGGNNHAIEHYKNTNYPLAVKLGTITAKGADVYSYDEDDMVEDTNLTIHLAHFGINMSKMEKTDKTMAELEIDLNQKVGEWDRIQESGSKLEPLYGPGFTGMRNLGNSCYMNSVVQVLFNIPDFINKYYANRDGYVKNSPADPSNDFNFQMSKLAYGLLSGNYSKDPTNDSNLPEDLVKPPKGIKPTSFKSLIGKGHVEFSTKRQQDAHEFLVYLLTSIERNVRSDVTSNENPVECFKFRLEERLECEQSHHVRYSHRDDYCLSVPILKDLALNKDKLKEYEQRKVEAQSKGVRLEPGDLVRPEIRLVDCLRQMMQNEIVADFYSSAIKSRGNALKSMRLDTFPDYLLIHARKFDFAPDWTPIKLDISLQVPDMLDLAEFRGKGKQPNEHELNDEPEQASGGGVSSAESNQPVLNETVVSLLMDMGFSLDASKRTAYHTRELNDSEAAINWAVAHMEDADFNKPFEVPNQIKSSSTSSSTKAKFDEDTINSITSLGFNKAQAIKALEATRGDLARAADWIFSHMDEIMDIEEGQASQEPAAATIAATSSSNRPTTTTTDNKSNYRDGSELYELVAFISHMGTNANVGHYVAHILKDGKWSIFNDENVARSENPPKDLAYLYVYRRI